MSFDVKSKSKQKAPAWSAKRIRSLREALGETQEVFARRLGVSWVTISRWEGSRGKPSRLAVQQLDAIKGGGS